MHPLLGVVVFLAPCLANQSGIPENENRPMGTGIVGVRPQDAPEVVLQLKYDGGELDRIFLTQFRKIQRGMPAVPARNNLCTDLCHAGLGGAPCGANCRQMIPIGLQTALRNGNETGAPFGEPRVSVCPVLCENNMGFPLCECTSLNIEPSDTVDWNAICNAFCVADNYVLNGCPACQAAAVPALYSAKVLTSSEGWVSWCNIQCRQGHGGAACNCDRAPFQ